MKRDKGVAAALLPFLLACCGLDFMKRAPEVEKPVSISPVSATIAPLGSIGLEASGGKKDCYTFSCTSCPSGCAVSQEQCAASAMYSAGRTGSVVDRIRVEDSRGGFAEASITISASLSVFPREVTVSPLSRQDFLIFGGQPVIGSRGVSGYRVTLAKRGGSPVILDGTRLYPEPDEDEPDFFQGFVSLQVGTEGDVEYTLDVTDANGFVVAATATVRSALEIFPPMAAVGPAEAAQFGALGGTPPYRFDFPPAGNFSRGSVEAFTGRYVAGLRPSSIDLVRVSDATGAASVAEVHVLRLEQAGPSPRRLKAFDFNGDGFQDVAVGHSVGDIPKLLLGDGAGGFALEEPVPDMAFFDFDVADLDGDGCADLAGVNRANDTVKVYVQRPCGGSFFPVYEKTFSTVVGFPPLETVPPTSIAIGDFFKDGKPDLAIGMDHMTKGVLILDGRGDGTFPEFIFGEGGAAIETGAPAEFLDAADADGDGNDDLAIALLTGAVKILWGDGEGGFAEGRETFMTESIVNRLLLADADGDGDVDLLIAVSNATADNPGTSVSVFRNSGGRGITGPAVRIPVGRQPGGMVVADVDGDGRPDIVSVSAMDGTVSVVPGEEDGAFGRAVNLAAGLDPLDVAAADFDVDGCVDIATANTGSSDVGVLYGIDTGLCFPTGRRDAPEVDRYEAGKTPRNIEVSDINADGFPDLVAVSMLDDEAGILFGSMTGRFTGRTIFETGMTPYTTAIGDLDGDRDLDVVVCNRSGNDLTVIMNIGDYETGISFSSRFETETVRPSLPAPPMLGSGWAAISDFDADGVKDIAVGDLLGAAVYYRDAEGGLREGARIAGISDLVGLAGGDFTGDGLDDVAAITRTIDSRKLFIAANSAEAGSRFSRNIEYDLDDEPALMRAEDVDLDGRQDIIVGMQARYAYKSGRAGIELFFGEGEGVDDEVDVETGNGILAVAVADFDLNGVSDVAILTAVPSAEGGAADTPVIVVCSGREGRRFATGGAYIVPTHNADIAAADFTVDGLPDIAYSDLEKGEIVIFRNTPDGFRGLTRAQGKAAEYAVCGSR